MSALSDALAWSVVVAFGAGAALDFGDRRDLARLVAAGAWALFGAFWLSVFPQFYFEMRSPIEGVLSLTAVPLCLSAGYLLVRGRDSLLVLSRAVAFMGVLYLPVETVPVVRRLLVETVAAQSHAVMNLFGYDPAFVTGPDYGYHNKFEFFASDGTELSTYIVTACTGIGSISIFGGLIAAVRAPLRRKVKAFAVAVGVIWVLNLLRNAFIAVAYGHQWFQQDLLVNLVAGAVYSDHTMTSYFVADRVIAQSLSVVALVGVTLLVLRWVPELLGIIEEALYVATRRDLDLADALGVDRGEEVLADGGS